MNVAVLRHAAHLRVAADDFFLGGMVHPIPPWLSLDLVSRSFNIGASSASKLKQSWTTKIANSVYEEPL